MSAQREQHDTHFFLKMAIRKTYGKTLARRVKKLERKANYNRPETKHYSSSTITTLNTAAAFTIPISTAIVRGTANNQRIGSKVKFLWVELRGFSTVLVDVYLCHTKKGNALVYGDFLPVTGGELGSADAGAYENTWIWNHYLNTNNGQAFMIKRRFKIPMSCEYLSDSVVNKNNLQIVIKNDSTTNGSFQIGWTVGYTDA